MKPILKNVWASTKLISRKRNLIWEAYLLTLDLQKRGLEQRKAEGSGTRGCIQVASTIPPTSSLLDLVVTHFGSLRQHLNYGKISQRAEDPDFTTSWRP